MGDALAAIGPRELSLLLAWFSPQLPIGGFGYSHGLEKLAEVGDLGDAAATEGVVRVALGASGRSDAILLAHAYRARDVGDGAALDAVRRLALALAPSAERREEAVFQGNAFVRLAGAVWPDRTGAAMGPDSAGAFARADVPLAVWPYRAGAAAPRGGQADVLADADVPLAVALGTFGAAHGLPLAALLHAHLTAFVAQLVSAAVRIVPLGQTDGQRILAALAGDVATIAAEAHAASLDEVGGAALGLDIASLQHEVQEVRLFRS